jgi:hypothetical protein
MVVEFSQLGRYFTLKHTILPFPWNKLTQKDLKEATIQKLSILFHQI